MTAESGPPVELTTFQAEEVAGLLAVCDDEARTSGEMTPWGRIEWAGLKASLSVTNINDAVDDLCRRAEYLISEGYSVGRNGASGARSLRQLADRISRKQ